MDVGELITKIGSLCRYSTYKNHNGNPTGMHSHAVCSGLPVPEHWRMGVILEWLSDACSNLLMLSRVAHSSKIF